MTELYTQDLHVTSIRACHHPVTLPRLSNFQKRFLAAGCEIQSTDLDFLLTFQWVDAFATFFWSLERQLRDIIISDRFIS